VEGEESVKPLSTKNIWISLTRREFSTLKHRRAFWLILLP